MGFEEDFEQSQKEMPTHSGGGDFYKFSVGDHVMRIMTSPVRKASRFGHGICYPGATYCDPVVLQEEYNKKVSDYNEECKRVKAAGGDVSKVKKPSHSNISVKWSVWAAIRKSGELAIVDLPNGIAEKLLNMKRDEDMGTNFAEFPMPYDVKIVVTQKKVANPGPKDVEYDIVASQTRKPVTQEELDLLATKTPVDQIIERMQVKAREAAEGTAPAETSGPIDYPEEDINPDDIPF